MKNFSVVWKASAKAAKQRKYRANAPLHLKGKMIVAPLTNDLAAKYSVKRIRLREGDTVRIARGEFSGISGKVNAIVPRQGIAYVDGAERIRKDGTKAFFPLRPSSLLVVEMNLEDKQRAASLATYAEKAAHGRGKI